MSIRSRVSPPRLLVLSGALAVALAMPMSALADTVSPPTIAAAESRHATIQLSGGGVLGRLVANTRVDFTCDPFLIFDWETGQEVESTFGSLEGGAVTILQASGRTINFGQGEFWGGDVVCDSATVNHRDVQVVASVSPWKSGSAVAGARVHIASADFNQSAAASTGAITIKLGR
jgi:hypothetical protein